MGDILRECTVSFEVEDDGRWTPLLDCTSSFIRVLLGHGGETYIANKNAYEATLRPDGTLVQNNCRTDFAREIRLQPGFAVEEDGTPRHPANGSFTSAPDYLRPIRDPVVIDALVTVYRGGASVQQYAARNSFTYEVRRSVDDLGNVHLMQTNLTTGRKREIYLLPSFFSFFSNGWMPIVDASSALPTFSAFSCIFCLP